MTNSQRDIQPEQLERALRALVNARPTNLGIEVQMPVLYPTGHAVTVVVTPQARDFVVHDAGFGMMQLSAAGIRLTDKLERRFSDLAANYGCDFVEGRMSRRCEEHQLVPALVLVANATRLLGDHVASAKRQSIIDFKREVSGIAAEALGDRERVRNDLDVVGDSGTLYRVNIVILDAQKDRPMAFIETIAEQASVNNRFRAFYDIARNDNFANVSRVAIYDDRHEWRSGDLLLLQNVSNLVPFSGTRARINRLAS